jgi:hypothetical protein
MASLLFEGAWRVAVLGVFCVIGYVFCKDM